jgi:hypothetical protein
MIESFRRAFNADFREDRYTKFLADLTARVRCPIEFRVSETPCFFPGALMTRLVDAAQAMVSGLLEDPVYRAAADAVVPARFRMPRSEALPTFIQVDFGIVKIGRQYEGRLVELQAFPSLYAFQVALGDAYAREYGLGRRDGLTPFLGGLDRDSYLALLRRTLVGHHDATNVVLLEIDPKKQKTRPDFEVTEELWGVRPIDISDVIVDGTRLFYRRGGKLTRITRIYNRVIPDELERTGSTLPFDFRDELEVEWLGSPDWFFRLSKFSIPHIRHPWVPITVFLNDALESDGRLGGAYADRERWLLKPLFSFAGGGIIFAPTDEQIAAIPPAEHSTYILQQRIEFTPVIDTPHGATQAELRIMLVREDSGYRAVLPLVRMGRGKMMGVDHNKGLAWVGASAAFIQQ